MRLALVLLLLGAPAAFALDPSRLISQYGHTSGGIVNVSLKSGTSAVHGTAYEFARRKAWDANSFQNNAVGAPKGEHYLDQYGGQIGGPVYIPKIYDGRNKSFFMFDYERYRENTPRPFTLSVPAPEFSTGDFSKLVNGVGQQIADGDLREAVVLFLTLVSCGLDVQQHERSVFEVQFPVLDQLHDGRGGQGLGNAGDPEQAVGLDRGLCLHVGVAKTSRIEQPFVSRHGEGRPGDPVLLDERCHQVIERGGPAIVLRDAHASGVDALHELVAVELARQRDFRHLHRIGVTRHG